MQERRLLIAVVVSMLIVFVWQMLFPPPMPKKKPLPATDTAVVSSMVEDTAIKQIITVVDTEVNPTVSDSPSISFSYSNDYHEMIFSETGGVLSSLNLNEYRYRDTSGAEKKVNLVELLPNYVPFSLQLDLDDKSQLNAKKWQMRSESGAWIFTHRANISELPPGLVFEKEYLFETGAYGFKWTVRIKNAGERDILVSSAKYDDALYGTVREGSFLVHFGPNLGANAPADLYKAQYDVTGNYEIAGDLNAAVAEKSWWHSIFGLPDPPDAVDWVALSNRYFVLALQPDGFKVDARYSLDGRKLGMWIILPSFSIKPGETKEFKFRGFAGPKMTAELKRFDPTFEKLDGMEPSVLPRKVSIARIMVGLLGWINKFVHNWGWSIILLTILVRLILFPLSHYQFKSMARMQQLKPKIEAIQAKYANDKERLQRELMNVYREAGVNPLGGCFPLLLQMPILIGLFIALQNAIELRGVPWVLWVHDLSIPDTIVHILGIPINPLPLLLCVTMYYQQKITPTPTTDPAQKQMMAIMPFMMTVLFYNFPSGLSLYWVIQNILSIAQQVLMMRSREVTHGNSR